MSRLSRGELYRLPALHSDPKRTRVFIVVSRQAFLNSRYSSAVCVPVYTRAAGLASEVSVGPAEGLQHDSVARCDEVTSVRRTVLNDFVGALNAQKLAELDRALAVALGLSLHSM